MVLLLLGMFTRDALERIAILESFKPTALDFARRALVVFHYGVASAKSCN